VTGADPSESLDDYVLRMAGRVVQQNHDCDFDKNDALLAGGFAIGGA